VLEMLKQQHACSLHVKGFSTLPVMLGPETGPQQLLYFLFLLDMKAGDMTDTLYYPKPQERGSVQVLTRLLHPHRRDRSAYPPTSHPRQVQPLCALNASRFNTRPSSVRAQCTPNHSRHTAISLKLPSHSNSGSNRHPHSTAITAIKVLGVPHRCGLAPGPRQLRRLV
jgi:hypothetical protein